MFCPYIYSLFIFKEKNETCRKRFLNALYHLPMVVPAYNCYHLYKMYKISYPMDLVSLVEKEKLQKKTAQLTFIETFLVCQLLSLQLVFKFNISGVWTSASNLVPLINMHWSAFPLQPLVLSSSKEIQEIPNLT